MDFENDGYDDWGKGLTDKKRRVEWEIWCLGGLALFMIMKLFTTNYVKKRMMIGGNVHTFYVKINS